MTKNICKYVVGCHHHELQIKFHTDEIRINNFFFKMGAAIVSRALHAVVVRLYLHVVLAKWLGKALWLLGFPKYWYQGEKTLKETRYSYFCVTPQKSSVNDCLIKKIKKHCHQKSNSVF